MKTIDLIFKIATKKMDHLLIFIILDLEVN